MILNESKHGDTYGVSHNEHAMLISVNGERAVLTPDECEAFMHELVFQLNEQRNGLWCGKPMTGTLESGSDAYADHP
jgi:hypothetical protein